MKAVTIHQAKTHLSRLIESVLAGDEVIILRGREPVAVLKPLRAPASKRRLGGLPALIVHMADDFDAPLTDFAEYME